MKREMKDSGIPWIGLMPKEWDLVSVKNIFAITRGRVIATTELVDEGMYPVYSSQTKDEGCLGFINTYDYEKEALTWTTDGANAGTVFYRRGKFNCTNVCGILTPKLELHISMRFLSYSVGFSSFFSKRADINGYKIMSNEMASIKITFPPLSTQQRIANFLDRKCAEIDELAALQETMIAELKKYKQSVITEAVTKGLIKNVPMKDSGVEWIGKIPFHWEMKAVKYILQKRNQKNDPIISEERLSLSIGIGITKYADKTTNLDRFKDDLTQYQLAYPDDIVLNSMNMIVGAVGKSAYFGCVSPVYYVMKPNSSIESSYYSFLLNTPRIRDVYHSLGKGIYAIERGEGKVNTCRLKVSYYDFGRIVIPAPPIIEQEQINNFLILKCAEIDELIAIKQQKLEALKEFKKSIIFEYITGKKEVME